MPGCGVGGERGAVKSRRWWYGDLNRRRRKSLRLNGLYFRPACRQRRDFVRTISAVARGRWMPRARRSG